MNKVRIGVIGIGNMGSSHAKNIFAGKIDGLSLAAVCDTSGAKKQWAAENLPGVPFFDNHKELIGSGMVDAIVIATPHYDHPTIAVCGFENGLHVLSEKPAGVYTKQVEEMNRAAVKSGKTFAIMYQERTIPVYAKVREIVNSGLLGELLRFVWINTTWFRSQSYYDSGGWRATWEGEGGGVLINQCPHNLDIWQWVFGMPTKVKGFCSYGKYHNIEVEDDFTAYAEYANGATGVFIATTGECPGSNRMEITGDKAKIVVEDDKIKLWKLEKSVKEHCFTTNKGFEKVASEYEEIIPAESKGGHHAVIFRNFAAAILSGEKLIAPGIEGINGLTISNAIHLSDWLGETVELPIDGEKFKMMLDEKIRNSTLKKADVQGQIADLTGSFN